jgi:hypothetical protein
MAASVHAVKGEIQVGDVVETVLGEGVVTHISKPFREEDPPAIEVDLGRKWLRMDQVRAFRHQGDQPQVQWHWDEHD